ncbi:P-type DNA transfer ATPase VirB11 [Parablastomonas sp. CN1-191]|uniref:P-type DNA transfer ATPase VirB11 n=1 Tax=Parablastomonas sp. CN1-191 TaxID=3400908 RepID=UPI003BF8E98A
MGAEPWYLSSFLEPIARFLAMPNVTDIYINRPGEVWTEALGGKIERHELPSLNEAGIARLARQIAASSAQGINREHPLLGATLPDGSRVQVVAPPATRGGHVLAIRRHVSRSLALDGFEVASEINTSSSLDSGTFKPIDLDGAKAKLRDAVINRRNILISGGTSTGKTTFLNALLREVPTDERLILIEDTPELELQHQNAVGLLAARSTLGEADVCADDLLIAALRMRPDRIILGELRGSEAFTFLRAVNTGHPGSMTTIHADTPARAVDQLALLVLQTGSKLSWDDVRRYVEASIDVFVQLGRLHGRRVITTVLAKS